LNSLRFGVASFSIGGLSCEPLAFWVAFFFIGGLCSEPLAFCVCLFFHRRSLFLAPYVFGLPLFSSEVFVFSPLRFEVASFFIGGLCFEPLAFWDCLFFYRRSLFLAPCILRLPLFSSVVFVFSPLSFRVASFFIGGLCFEPTNEGCNNTHLFVALAYLA
jgi:hypothetical protein